MGDSGSVGQMFALYDNAVNSQKCANRQTHRHTENQTNKTVTYYSTYMGKGQNYNRIRFLIQITIDNREKR